MNLWVSAFVGVGLVCVLALPRVTHAQFEAIEAGCDHASTAIDVRVRGVRSEHGYVTLVLYGDNPDDFLVKGKKIFKQRFAARQGTVALCVSLPEPGVYAAAAYHDENGNTKLDKNWIGLPKEGFGVSNNPSMFLAPPSHEEAAFTVADGISRVDIKLNY